MNEKQYKKVQERLMLGKPVNERQLVNYLAYDVENLFNTKTTKRTYYEVKNNGELESTFDLKLTEEDRKQMKLIENLLFEETSRQLEEFYKKVDKMVEIMLRNYVTPPIKGEITKGKIRWRGLRIVWQKIDTYDAFVGIRQRDVLILPNGDKIPWNNFEIIRNK